MGGISKFLAGGDTPPIPHIYMGDGKKLHVHEEAPCTSHTSSGHLTSARFQHFVCHRYIWYIFLLVCSVFLIQ